MKIIAHRGNVHGPNPLEENSPEYIDKAIEMGFDAEVDIRVENEEFYLGHDNPQYYVPMSWLSKRKDYIWIHCKNLDCLRMLSLIPVEFNYFWHETDQYTLTSKKIGWVYPGRIPYEKSILVLPENTLYFNEKYIKENKLYGICTDFCENYKKMIFSAIVNI